MKAAEVRRMRRLPAPLRTRIWEALIATALTAAAVTAWGIALLHSL